MSEQELAAASPAFFFGRTTHSLTSCPYLSTHCRGQSRRQGDALAQQGNGSGLGAGFGDDTGGRRVFISGHGLRRRRLGASRMRIVPRQSRRDGALFGTTGGGGGGGQGRDGRVWVRHRAQAQCVNVIHTLCREKREREGGGAKRKTRPGPLFFTREPPITRPVVPALAHTSHPHTHTRTRPRCLEQHGQRAGGKSRGNSMTPLHHSSLPTTHLAALPIFLFLRRRGQTRPLSLSLSLSHTPHHTAPRHTRTPSSPLRRARPR